MATVIGYACYVFSQTIKHSQGFLGFVVSLILPFSGYGPFTSFAKKSMTCCSNVLAKVIKIKSIVIKHG